MPDSPFIHPIPHHTHTPLCMEPSLSKPTFLNFFFLCITLQELSLSLQRILRQREGICVLQKSNQSPKFQHVPQCVSPQFANNDNFFFIKFWHSIFFYPFIVTFNAMKRLWNEFVPVLTCIIIAYKQSFPLQSLFFFSLFNLFRAKKLSLSGSRETANNLKPSSTGDSFQKY